MVENILFINGNIYTYDNQKRRASSVYVEKGIIKAIGLSDELKLQSLNTNKKVIDLDGAFVIPGLVDSHLHLPAQGMKMFMLDFSNTTSKDEMLNMIRKRVEQTSEGEWIIGVNWNENHFSDKKIPTIQELDDITTQHPIYLTRVCYHVHIANSFAFQLAGVTESISDRSDGSYGRDSEGKLDGLILENASEPFTASIPKPDFKTQKDYVRLAMEHALSLGLTGAHTEDLRFISDLPTLIKIYRELEEDGIWFRTNHLIYHPYLDELAAMGLTAGSGNEWFNINSVKIFSDGAIGGRTALLTEPYHDQPDTKGMAVHTQEELYAITRKARELKMPIAVHAIGDGGAEMTIKAMEKYPVEQYTTSRDRLIHAQVLNKDLVERLKNIQVAVDIQPRFVASDFPWILDRVGEHRKAYLCAWKKLIVSGLMCAGGSDAPVEPMDPLLGIHAAVTRKVPYNNHQGYLLEERLTINEAITLFTLGSAQAATEERKRGTIEVGKYADFTIFDRDLHELQPDELLKAKVLMTIVNGKVAYSNI